MSNNDDPRIFIYEEPNFEYNNPISNILGNTIFSRQFEISIDRKEIENDNHQNFDYLSEANTIFDRIAEHIFSNAIYGNRLEQMEDRLLTAAINESLSHYKTQERKPNIKLDIKSEKASDNHIKEKCAICKEDFELEENITSLLCNHILHTDCISEWVKYKSECPVCRQQIQTIDTLENKD